MEEVGDEWVVVCVVGGKDEGKTAVAEALIKALVRAGLRVGAVKHSKEGMIRLEPEGVDTVRLKDAGASVVGFADKEKVVLLSLSLPLNTVLEVFEVLFDVVVVEGLKESDYSKVVVDDKKEYGNVIAHISIKDKDWRRKISAVVRMVKKSRGDKKVTLVADEDVLSANRFVSGLSLRLARALFESLRGGEDSSVVSLVARLK